MTRVWRAWLFVAVTVMALTGCGPGEPEEARIRALIADMEAGLEAGERGTFMQPVADDFVGNQGMGRDQLNGLLLFYLRRYQDLNAQLGPVSIEVFGESEPLSAEAAFKAVVTGGSGLLPEDGRVFDVQTQWRKDGEWQLVNAEWDPPIR